jgi:rhodanese-related sulfurtransferase
VVELAGLGRITIPEWLGLPYGIVVVGVVLMALFMFWGSEQLEHIFGGRDLKKEPRWRYAGAAGLLVVAFGVLLIGDATTADKYARIASAQEQQLSNRGADRTRRAAFTIGNDTLKTILLDVRPENEFNLFHLPGSQNISPDDFQAFIPEIHAQQALNTVFVVVSNDEKAATEAWKTLVAESVPNAYILEGGINNWIATFGEEDPNIVQASGASGEDTLKYTFPAALGDRYECADPSPHEWELEFTPKIKLQIQRDKSGGGCG